MSTIELLLVVLIVVGNCTFRFRSEVNVIARIQAGSLFIVRKRN